MRHKLKKLNGTRTRFAGRVERLGSKKGWKGALLPTLLLKDIFKVDDPEHILTDHLWMNVGKQLELAVVGDIIEFDARVTPYEKGYKSREDLEIYGEYLTEIDYRLERPTKVKIQGKDDE